MEDLCKFAAKSVDPFSKYRVHVWLVKHVKTGHANIIPPPEYKKNLINVHCILLRVKADIEMIWQIYHVYQSNIARPMSSIT